MDLSIVIVSWNISGLLRQCLESVYAHPPECLFEVVVVDNNSDDDSVPMVQKRYPGVRLFTNRDNLGFARATNQGIRESSGRYVLLLNGDTIVHQTALSNMVSCMDLRPDVSILGAYVLNQDGTTQACFGSFPSLFAEAAFVWGINRLFPFSLMFPQRPTVVDEFFETDWVLGAAMMVRRDVLNRVGLLDESYFMYSEEVDLARRVKNAEGKVCVLRDAHIVHLGGQSTKQVPAAMKAQLLRSKVKYFYKHHGAAAAWLLKLIFLSSIYGKKWAYGLLGEREKSRLWSESLRYFAAA